MQQYSNSLFRQFSSSVTGNAATGVSVNVYELGTTNAVTLYADDDLGGATLPNPLTTNDIGFYSFYAPDGKYTLNFGSSQFPDLNIQLIDALSLVSEFNTAQAATGFILIDNGFSAGYAVTQRNEALLDGGVYYVWKGALPKTVTAGSSVASTGGIGNGAWQAVLDNALRQELLDGTANINGSPASELTNIAQLIGLTETEYGGKLVYPAQVLAKHDAPIDIYLTPKGWHAPINKNALKATTVEAIYVDPRSSAYTTTQDGTETNPYRSLKQAVQHSANAKTIILAAGEYGYYDGLQNTAFDYDVNIICPKGIAKFSSNLRPRNWVEDGTYPGLYSTKNFDATLGESAALSYAVFDISGDRFTTKPVQLSVKTLAQLQGGEVGYFNDSGASKFWCRMPLNASPNRNGQLKHRVLNNLIKMTGAGRKVYIENCHFRDGQGSYDGAPISVQLSALDSQMALVNVRGDYSYLTANDGIAIRSNGIAYLIGCGADYNADDGLSYNCDTSVMGYKLSVVEIDCSGYYNGRNGTLFNNGSTTHDNAHIIRVNCDYRYNDSRNIQDIGENNVSFNVGVTCLYPQSGEEDIFCGGISPDFTEMWLVDCVADSLRVLASDVYISNSTQWTISNRVIDPSESGTITKFDQELTADIVVP